jgi:hypothetical protein
MITLFISNSCKYFMAMFYYMDFLIRRPKENRRFKKKDILELIPLLRAPLLEFLWIYNTSNLCNNF